MPNNWIGPVAVGHERAWGLIRFGEEGLRAAVSSVTFDTPPPDGLATRVELNGGELVPNGAPEGSDGGTVQGVPGTITGVVQIGVWFKPTRSGIEYFSPSTTIRYAVDGRTYAADYPVGVGICSVERVTAATPCDVGQASDM